MMTINAPGHQESSGPTHIGFYVAGTNHILAMGADAGADSPVMTGDGYLRSNTAFSNATLNGPFVFTSNALTKLHAVRSDQDQSGHRQL